MQESLKVSEDLQELYEALESKETQLLKLEKLVKQMENQEELSQAQRTRLENRIAKLELALKEGQQAYRYVHHHYGPPSPPSLCRSPAEPRKTHRTIEFEPTRTRRSLSTPRKHTCRLHRQRAGAESVDQSASQPGHSIYKWLLKPFYRDPGLPKDHNQDYYRQLESRHRARNSMRIGSHSNRECSHYYFTDHLDH